jgi:predicted GIY-YIG superfamily endonuclease
LRLEENHYFIDKSNNVENRLRDHLKGIVCGMTKRYKPLAITVIPNCHDSELDLYIKKYMAKYGINKVRGGLYMKNKFEENELKKLKAELEILSKHSMLKLPMMPPEFPIIPKEQSSLITPTAKPTSKPPAGSTVKPTSKPIAKITAKPTTKPTSKPTAKPTVKKDIVLKIPIKNANGTCYNCGKDGHYVENCNQSMMNDNNNEDEESELNYDDLISD